MEQLFVRYFLHETFCKRTTSMPNFTATFEFYNWMIEAKVTKSNAHSCSKSPLNVRTQNRFEKLAYRKPFPFRITKQFLLFILHTKLKSFCVSVIFGYQFRIHVYLLSDKFVKIHFFMHENLKLPKRWSFLIETKNLLEFFSSSNHLMSFFLHSKNVLLHSESYFNLFAECFLSV